ncbi:hypothetical protein J3F84DRAFT_377479 [Trichoderma pleuroticola]
MYFFLLGSFGGLVFSDTHVILARAQIFSFFSFLFAFHVEQGLSLAPTHDPGLGKEKERKKKRRKRTCRDLGNFPYTVYYIILRGYLERLRKERENLESFFD